MVLYYYIRFGDIYVLYRMWEADSKKESLGSTHSAEETDEIIKRLLSGREWKERFIKVVVDWKKEASDEHAADFVHLYGYFIQTMIPGDC